MRALLAVGELVTAAAALVLLLALILVLLLVLLLALILVLPLVPSSMGVATIGDGSSFEFMGGLTNDNGGSCPVDAGLTRVGSLI